MRVRCDLRTGRVFAGVVVMVAAGLVLFAPPASAFNFDLTDARDWARAHYNDRLYESDNENGICCVLLSLAYRKGAGVPFRNQPQNNYSAWWVVPDSWGGSVSYTSCSNSWHYAHSFWSHFEGYEPSGTTWVQKTRHKCYYAPTSDGRWSGGHVVFYHHADSQGNVILDPGPNGGYFHSAVIYGRNVDSAFGEGNGTCKVERTGLTSSPFYRNCNFINLQRKTTSERLYTFVQVNTLTNN